MQWLDGERLVLKHCRPVVEDGEVCTDIAHRPSALPVVPCLHLLVRAREPLETELHRLVAAVEDPELLLGEERHVGRGHQDRVRVESHSNLLSFRPSTNQNRLPARVPHMDIPMHVPVLRRSGEEGDLQALPRVHDGLRRFGPERLRAEEREGTGDFPHVANQDRLAPLRLDRHTLQHNLVGEVKPAAHAVRSHGDDELFSLSAANEVAEVVDALLRRELQGILHVHARSDLACPQLVA
mmetsp:Transcript_25800/g.58060  ORF Transcript_25800/g.58060 Transcript_25800/m.58060 type:complete len:239 (-) Transcript_25800:632-1348(-)